MPVLLAPGRHDRRASFSRLNGYERGRLSQATQVEFRMGMPLRGSVEWAMGYPRKTGAWE
jgi:hypothetical protein